VGSVNKKYEKYMTGGNGILLLGILWLIFWLGPAFFLFREDSRWGHNFALPIMFITVGLAYNTKFISTNLVACISSYLTIPTLLGFWNWAEATKAATYLLIIFVILFFGERARDNELIKPNTRFKAWLQIHLLTLAYIGLAHMTFIFFAVRWYNPTPFLDVLPIEHHVSTSLFNIMLLGLVVLSIMERFVQKIGKLKVTKAAFIWSVLMIIIPIAAIAITGE
jgi:hypothetical protein